MRLLRIRHNSFLGISLRKVYARAGYDWITGLRVHAHQTTFLGTEYGGWNIPLDLLPEHSVCYCGGAGEDISFDLALHSLGYDVYTFDPTPRSIAYVEKIGKVKFFPYGLWSENETKRFYAPKHAEHVSHSILNLQKTEVYFDAACKTVAEIMRELGHKKVDLLKLDIEGAEYAVIDSALADHVPISILCVEFDELRQPADRDFLSRIRATARALSEAGYRLIKVDRSNYTFVSASVLWQDTKVH